MMFVCLPTVFRIIVVIVGVVPFLAPVMAFGAWTIAVVFTVTLGNTIIAFGWFVARPLLSALLFFAAVSLAAAYLCL